MVTSSLPPWCFTLALPPQTTTMPFSPKVNAGVTAAGESQSGKLYATRGYLRDVIAIYAGEPLSRALWAAVS